ncbi:MAG TPA: Flp pilus assembly protein CpaB [Caulobacteraceae bacterium]|jgi:pilus assembly protein CpaB|nr:Flp pilus assembly protein CpaB [Caulobacteraceae bacterium]
MGPVRILILVVALLAAVGAVVVVRGMSKAQAPKVVVAAAPVVVEKPSAQVLVAKRDLPAGTRLQQADMTWQAWPQESLNPAFILQTAAPNPRGEAAKITVAAADVAKAAVGAPDPAVTALVGAVVREPILANEPMTDRKLVRSGSAGIMAITLEPGMRAVSVPLSAETAAGGFILPGDHVDVVQSRQLEGPAQGGGKHVIASTVMRNVKVLAIDQNLTAPKGSSVIGATATLELNAQQAEVLVQAKAQGDLTLVLRSYADANGPAVTVAQNTGRADDGVFRASVVRVFKNGQASEVTVNR